jgi:hypothetical protein
MNFNLKPVSRRSVPLLGVFLMMAGCGSSSSKDPKTVLKSDLNPPAQLVSVTDDQKMVLQWTITNTEDDIVGYNVYVAKGDLNTLASKLAGTAFANVDLGKQQVRRCNDTSALFSVFGFDPKAKQAQEDCDEFEEEAGGTPPASASGAQASSGSDLPLADKESTETGTFVACQNFKNGASLAAPGKLSIDINKAIDVEGEPLSKNLANRVGVNLSCQIPSDATLSDGSKGITNGTNYVAFVVAVKGDDANEISYTSNFVQDTPAKYTSFSFGDATTGLEGEDNAEFLPISLTMSNGSPTGALEKTNFTETDVASCNSNGNKPNDNCKLSKMLNFPNSTNETRRFAVIGDATGGGERLLLAGESTDPDNPSVVPNFLFAVAQPRVDFANGRPGIQQAGDVGLEYSSQQDTAGNIYTAKNLEIVSGSLFYVAVKGTGDNWHYGKLYFQSLSTTAGQNNVAAGKGKKSFKAYFALQPQPNNVFVETASTGNIFRMLKP